MVAINLWYSVGSKHESPGKTGFAHLFEHFMFQGSRHVGKAEHMAIVQGAGGVNNATTYFDRTNYFETLPSHQVELGLWLEADRMATLLDALSQENLDNQREVVKNEKRQSYDNRPYGSFYEKLMAHVFPDGHPYHHTPIGSMEDLDAASLEDVTSFFRTWYGPEQRGADRGRRRGRGAGLRRRGAPLRGHPADAAAAGVPAAGHRARTSAPRSARWCRTPCRWSGSTSASACRPTARREFDALEVGSQILAGGKGSRLYHRLVRDERIAQDVVAFALPLVSGNSIFAGWVTARPESDAETVERAFLAELDRLASEKVTDDELARARALIESAELGAVSRMEEVADRLSMYATYFDRPELINEQLGHYLAVDAEQIRDVAADVFRPDNRAVVTYVPAADGAGDRERGES